MLVGLLCAVLDCFVCSKCWSIFKVGPVGTTVSRAFTFLALPTVHCCLLLGFFLSCLLSFCLFGSSFFLFFLCPSCLCSFFCSLSCFFLSFSSSSSFFLCSFSSNIRRASMLVNTLAPLTALIFLRPVGVWLGRFRISAKTDRLFEAD